jgi:hypothetical protein
MAIGEQPQYPYEEAARQSVTGIVSSWEIWPAAAWNEDDGGAKKKSCQMI